jgi:hypothetical protein
MPTWRGRFLGAADTAVLLGLTVVLYLLMAACLPVDIETGSLVRYLERYSSVFREWLRVILSATLIPVFLTGVWLKRWAPALPLPILRNYLCAWFLLMWAHPADLLDWFDPFTWSAGVLMMDGPPRQLVILPASLLILFLLFKVLAAAVEGEGEPPVVPTDTLRVVEYWFLGWTLFFAAFAGLLMRAVFFDRENVPFTLAGIVMAYWSFRWSVSVRRSAGLGTRGHVDWANLVAGLWFVCTVALWITFEVWG